VEAKKQLFSFPDLGSAGASTSNKLHYCVDRIDFLRVGGENLVAVKN
jgi:hypothetical protein